MAAPVFPNGVKDWSDKADFEDFVEAKNINEAYAEIIAIENSLISGVPQGVPLSFGYNRINHTGKTAVPFNVLAQGLSYINLLGRGSFEDGTGEWMTNDASVVTASTTRAKSGKQSLKIVCSGQVSYNHKLVDAKANEKFYFSAWYYIEAYSIGDIALGCDGAINSISGGPRLSITDKSTGSWRRVSFICSRTTDGAIYFNCIFDDAATGTIYFDDCIAINLTSMYGIGNEPSLAICDVNFPYGDSYVCTENIMLENRRDNLVDNGNCEKGISGWFAGPVASTLSVENGRFKLYSAQQYGSQFQFVNLKPNTDYYLSANTTFPATVGMVNSANIFQWVKQGTGTFNSGNNNSAYVVMDNVGGAGTGYVDSIMLVEGTVAPEAYKSCDLQRFVVEGKFTSDDTVKIENGQVSGLLNWKHRILYGKDYSCYFQKDYSGFKSFSLSKEPINYRPAQCIGIRPDGGILTTGDTESLNRIGFGDEGTIWLTASDADTGWAESLNPNVNETKAFMNGWKATANDGTRYTSWESVMDGTAPAAQSIDYVVNNIALNYPGYQVHYKLANPEPINDINTHIEGNLWNIEPGDNYVFVDSGIVLGEVPAKITIASDNTYAHINIVNYPDQSYLPDAPLKNKVESFIQIYKNGVPDSQKWQFLGLSDLTYGNVRTQTPIANFDTNATYTVDYKILATEAPQAMTSLTCSYAQDVFSAITGLSGQVEQKQQKDSALDTLVDLSMYEEIGTRFVGRFVNYNSASIKAIASWVVKLVPKSVGGVVTTTVSDFSYATGSGNFVSLPPNDNVQASVSVSLGSQNILHIEIYYIGSDTAVLNALVNNGGFVSIRAKIDCREKV